MHLIAGISWIGNSFYFMWLDSTLELEKPKGARAGENEAGVESQLWMVHGGGFYRVEKRRIAPGGMPAVLHWFKWEATFTWLSGFALLWIVYYAGGIYLVDPAISSISPKAATALGLGVLAISWFIYDFLWTRAWAERKPVVTSVFSAALVAGVAYGLGQVLSGRAAYLHVGAMLGTLMVLNVWVRILPAQRQMISATDQGRKPDYELGARAKRRSVHNNYMTFPVLFIMISNHFPSTYGHAQSWLVLLGLMLAGASVRHFMNRQITGRAQSAYWALLVAGLLLGATFWTTLPASRERPAALAGQPTGAFVPGSEIRGVAVFEGELPEDPPLVLPPGCAEQHAAPPRSRAVTAKSGRLANVFVWVRSGVHGQYPVPTDEVLVDQRGCIYAPRVIGVRVGQKLTFINSDPLFHNVRTVSRGNSTFNLAMPTKDMRLTRIFDQQEIMVNAKCDVHPWMASYIGVVAHPFFAITAEDGSFVLRGLPDGEYELEAWHEVGGIRRAKAVVKAGRTADLIFHFSAKQRQN